MNMGRLIGGLVVLGVIVAGVIFYLQSFDAQKITCEDIPAARTQLQAQYETGVAASVSLYTSARESAEEKLSQCLRAEPKDPCEAEQAARDTAYKSFFAIEYPPADAPYEDFQQYFQKRDDAYEVYKTAKAALDQCRAANPPKPEVPYELSDTKACFDVYDASMETAQDTFTQDTQTMRTALAAALAALDAREKACNPPTGDEQFTELSGGTISGQDISVNIQSCRPLYESTDAELAALRQTEAALKVEIADIETTIGNAQGRAGGLRTNIAEVDTYIPPESTKSQFEGALNALRGQRKASLETALEYYEKLIERKQGEKAKREQELSDVQAQIAARLEYIKKENEARARNYPTNVHLAGPDECKYYHCHGTLCGIPDPARDGCGHGTTTEDDIECKAFIDAYLKAAGSR